MLKKAFLPALAFLLILNFSSSTFAGQTNIAVAANFTAAAKEIATAFKVKTGHDVILSFGSTGKLYVQIANNAPFTVFLAADSKRPEKLETEGLAVAGSRFTYAKGKIVLFSPNDSLFVNNPLASLNDETFAHIAIANPLTAPYGAAAMSVLEKNGVFKAVKGKIVQGDNIAQTYQFVITGNAQAGFVALSQVIRVKGGSKWIVPDGDYAPIKQQAVLLKKGANDDVAKTFIEFLKGAEAIKIIHSYGYATEE